MELVPYQLEGSVAMLTMDDGKANALSPAMLAAVDAALDRATADRAVVLLSGREDRFSAGFDLGVLRAGGPEAVAIEPAVAEFWRRNADDNRLGGLRAIAGRLAELGALPADLDVPHAADLLWTHVSFDTAEALIRERGWTPDAFTRWSARLVKAAFGIA